MWGVLHSSNGIQTLIEVEADFSRACNPSLNICCSNSCLKGCNPSLKSESNEYIRFKSGEVNTKTLLYYKFIQIYYLYLHYQPITLYHPLPPHHHTYFHSIIPPPHPTTTTTTPPPPPHSPSLHQPPPFPPPHPLPPPHKPSFFSAFSRFRNSL